MRIRKTKFIKYRNLLVILFTLVPIGLFMGYFLTLDYIMKDSASFVYDLNPSTDEFYPLDEINLTILDEMARNFSERQDLYHTPINLSQETIFNVVNGTKIVHKYSPTDNAGLYTGMALSAECFRYASLEEGDPDKAQAKHLIHKMLDGLAKLIEVPNGGLGPNYSGVIARFYASPQMLADGNWSWLLSDSYKHFNGTGKFSNWRVRLYTSKDELGGYFLGIASAFKLVKDDPWVQNITRLIIGQIAENFLRDWWQEMHGDGTPCGAQLQGYGLLSAEWKLTVMKMATLAYPDNERYAQLYNYYLSKEMGLFFTNGLSVYNSIDAYYANVFAHDVILALFLLEDNPVLQNILIKNYDNSYRIFKGQRDAYYNSIFLAMTTKRLPSNPVPHEFNVSKILWDTLDQLWRFHTTGWCPIDDTFGGKNRSISRSDLDPLGINYTVLDNHSLKWHNFMENSSLAFLYRWAKDTMLPGIFDTHYIMPAIVGMYPTDPFFWGNNPFKTTGGYSRWRPDKIRESPGTAFTLPYWVLRYYGLI